MSALPIIIVTGGRAIFTDGTLFQLPTELQTAYQLKWYTDSAGRGWSKCPQGYHVYVAVDTSGTKYIAPGLNISGEKRPSKKFYSNPYYFSKSQIERFVGRLVDESAQINRAKDNEVRDRKSTRLNYS